MIDAPVRSAKFMDALSKRAPSIAVVTFCVALLGAWTSAPIWLCNGIATLVGILALLLLVARGRRRRVNATDELNIRDVIAYELAGEGTPRGSYLLGFFGFLTIMLIGFQSPYRMLVFAGLGLAAVWGFVNVRYPAGDDTAQD